MRIALYMRVSTVGQSVEPQERELSEWARKCGHEVVAREVDVMSGGKAQREGLERIMALVEGRAIEGVAAVKLDRMARSLSHFAKLVGIFERCGVALVLTSQGIDTSATSPVGRMQMGILAVIAEFERELIRERTRAGLAVARAAGKALGHKSERIPEDWERIVAEWEAQGESRGFRDLGRRLGGINSGSAWKKYREWKIRRAA